MNDSSNPEPADRCWSHVFVMIALGIAVFASIEFIPAILDGAAGAMATVFVGGIFLYYFGKHTGTLLAEADN